MSDSCAPIVILYRGGRLPSWDQLSDQQRAAYQDEHVELMLSVARQHGLLSIEGYRLVCPQQNWQRWWTMKFPDLRGAEAWMDAEIAPPYGDHGFYRYELARPWKALPDNLPTRDPWPRSGQDPHVVPALAVDSGSAVALTFGSPVPHDTEPSADGLRHVEAYRLCGPGASGQIALLHEFDRLDQAEDWIQTDSGRSTSPRAYQLGRRWAPDYFANWPPEISR